MKGTRGRNACSANRLAGKLLVLGLGAVLWHNWRQWQHDRALLDSMPPAGPVPDWRTWPEQPKVSILVAAWNEADAIQVHIESFLGLSYPHKELILCAGGEDGTHEIARAYAGDQVTLLRQRAGEGKQAALRKGLPHASGEIIFLTDADCLLDDDAFLHTLAPLVLKGEQVTTGSSRPLTGQRNQPFVLHQWAAEAYIDARRPQYASGLLGRNCAVRRTALEEVGAFGASVQTGTDYHLAKALMAKGYRLCFVPESAVVTRYPETGCSYSRRQSRWLRNPIIHGPAFRAYSEALNTLRTSLVGLSMLLLPGLAVIAGPIVLASWGVLFAQSFLARIRYLRFLQARHGVRLRIKQVVCTPAYLFADFFTWSRSLVDLFLHRDHW